MCFRIDNSMSQVHTISPWLFNAHMDAVMKEMKTGMGRIGVKFLEEGKECRLPQFLYADDLVLYGELEDLKMMRSEKELS